MKRTAINRTSRKRASESTEYAALRRVLLKLDDPAITVRCEAGPLLALRGVGGCTGVATELHHLRKRSSSGALCNPANVRAVCHNDNMAIEDHPEEAHAAGLVVREGDPEWDALGVRAWRER